MTDGARVPEHNPEATQAKVSLGRKGDQCQKQYMYVSQFLLFSLLFCLPTLLPIMVYYSTPLQNTYSEVAPNKGC